MPRMNVSSTVNGKSCVSERTSLPLMTCTSSRNGLPEVLLIPTGSLKTNGSN